MQETMRITLLQLRGTLQAKNMKEENIRWMLTGAIIRVGYHLGLLKRGEPIPESMYRHISTLVQEIMNENE